MPRIAVTYIGHSPVSLTPRPGDPYKDANGQPLTSLMLSAGDTLQMEEAEALGQTYLVNAANSDATPVLLGIGVAVLPQHQGRDWRSLVAERFPHTGGWYNYEFHLPRQDFQLVAPHPRQFAAPPAPIVTPPVSPAVEATVTAFFASDTPASTSPAQPATDEEHE